MHPLKLHPDFQSASVSQIDVDVTRNTNALGLRYIVTGNIGAILIPARASPARTDGLWRHTCFELFVRRAPSPNHLPKGEGKIPGVFPPPTSGQGAGPYFEFNFSPSSQWAAYSFTDYREGMASLESAPPRIETHARNARFALAVTLDLKSLGSAALTVGLSAVIEETSGAKSYWALRHPAGKADFHHSDCFALVV